MVLALAPYSCLPRMVGQLAVSPGSSLTHATDLLTKVILLAG